MTLSLTIATCHIEGLTPYSQSRKHDEPRLEGELPENYNKRTWKAQSLIENGSVHVPAAGVHQCLVSAAKYSKRQIPGQGKATWTKKFEAGITLLSNIDLGITPDQLEYIDIYANADGIRGSGKRVMRRFPIIQEWEATFDCHILDPIIVKDVFEEILEIAGMFVGLGRYRPEKGGTNGRFKINSIEWNADIHPIRKAA